MCLSGNEMLCRNGGIIGVNTNGGFAEYIVAPERNAFRIPDDVEWDVATSLSITTITPHHALKEASLKLNEYLVIFGASGNTGVMATQFGKKMGAKVQRAGTTKIFVNLLEDLNNTRVLYQTWF